MPTTATKGVRDQAPISNEQVAATLEEVANLLEEQGANPFRVAAYRRAANTVRQLQGSVARISQVEGTAYDSLTEGQTVEYEEGSGPKGPCAEHVKVVS